MVTVLLNEEYCSHILFFRNTSKNPCQRNFTDSAEKTLAILKKDYFFLRFHNGSYYMSWRSFVCIFMYSQFDFRLRILDVKRFKNYQSRGLTGGQLVTMVTTLFNHLFKLLNCFLLYLGYWLLLRKHKKCITELFGNILFFRSCPTNKSIFKGSNKKHVKHRKRC